MAENRGDQSKLAWFLFSLKHSRSKNFQILLDKEKSDPLADPILDGQEEADADDSGLRILEMLPSILEEPDEKHNVGVGEVDSLFARQAAPRARDGTKTDNNRDQNGRSNAFDELNLPDYSYILDVEAEEERDRPDQKE